MSINDIGIDFNNIYSGWEITKLECENKTKSKTQILKKQRHAPISRLLSKYILCKISFISKVGMTSYS